MAPRAGGTGGPPAEAARPAAGRDEPPPMGDRAARGFVWLMGQTVLLRVITLAGQLVLAYLLTEEDFGVVGLAMTVHAFASIVQQGGISEILVNRQAGFRRWCTPAFWMSLTLGLGAGAVMAVGAPLASLAYHNPRIIPLLLVLALSMIPASLIVVPEAKLNADLRFRTLAVVGVASAGSMVLLSVVFAEAGMGAMSMVLPRPIVLTVHWLVVMTLARPPVRMRARVGRWKYLVSDNITLVLGKLCMIATHQGDYIVLGVLTTERVVGIYYFAFQLSMQTMTLVTTSMANVLFPVLSKLGDAKRQTAAFLRAARLLAIAGVPLCLMQAGVADPLIRAVFPAKWIPSIPILQILSLGMALRLVGSPAGSLFNAQGRFRTVLVLYVCYAVVFLAAVSIGAVLAEGIGVAIGAASYFALLGPVHMYVAVRRGGAGWVDIWRVYALPVAASSASIGAGMILASLVPHMDYSWRLAGRSGMIGVDNWIKMGMVVVVGGGVYLLLIRVFAASVLEELLGRFASLPVAGTVSKQLSRVLGLRGESNGRGT